VTQGALDAQVANGGAIVADGGMVTLHGAGVERADRHGVNQSGVAEAVVGGAQWAHR
jgi:hypothetical protein